MKAARTTRHEVPETSPREKKPKRERQSQILAAALDEFGANGYAETRLDDVAQRAGVAKGTIYLYFHNKEALFRAVVRSLIPKVFDTLPEVPSGSSHRLLAAALSNLYGHVVKDARARAIIRLLIAESGKFPRLAEIHYREVVQPGLAIVRQMIERGVASGEFDPVKATEFPQIVIGPGIIAIMWKLLFAERHPLDLDAYMQAHLEFILRGLEKTQVENRSSEGTSHKGEGSCV